MKTAVYATALLSLTIGLVLAYPSIGKSPLPNPPSQLNQPVDPVAHVRAAQRPRIEAVFVLDTTGSMSGLIQAAKENIWSIASSMALAEPTPELAIGLVAYRDRGDDYVTRVIDLSTDLDSVYAQLMDFQAGGGGDTPEAVNKALADAINTISWSQGQDAYRTVFLVGDAPPKEYQDEPSFPQTLKIASRRGIVVNTIQAGSAGDTREKWQAIAALAGGAYFEVAQSGSAVAVATPFDESIAELSRELDDTRMFYGDAETQREMAGKQAAASKLHAAASPAVQAKRARFNASEAGASNLLGDHELVDAVTTGKLSLDEVPVANLPAPLQALSAEERLEQIQTTGARRAELKAEIGRLTAQRQAHIESTLAKETSDRDSLDYRLFETVRKQAKDKGLTYESAKPVH